jgi:hypothetical protein
LKFGWILSPFQLPDDTAASSLAFASSDLDDVYYAVNSQLVLPSGLRQHHVLAFDLLFVDLLDLGRCLKKMFVLSNSR